MSNYTSLGEWSDSEEDDLIRNIDEEAILRGLFGNNYIPRGTEEWNDSEDDEWIRNINEDEILRAINDQHTGRGEKRKTLSDSEEEPFTKRNNAFSSDTDPIPDVDDEGSTTEDEHEQTGQGKKRKAEPPIFQQSEQDLHASTAPVCLPDIDCEPLPLLTESTYNELLLEIQKDPDLVKILNDFPSFTNDCEVMNERVWNSINNDTNNDITPLQMEINNY